MIKRLLIAKGFFFICLISYEQKNEIRSDSITITSNPIAFPDAEGFGKFTTGGRGGKVMIVSNVNDSGAGSFREAVEGKGPRIIVFGISGTIHLLSNLKIGANVTIAGQSAPGDGICVADYPISLAGDNIIIRYMRFRMGDRYQNEGMVNGAGGDDAFGGQRCKNIIVDHCTMSWSTDEVFSVYAGDSTTLQWNLISEPLNYSYHFETGDKDFEHHGFGGIIGGLHTSFHHNLYAHCVSRTPRFNGIRHTPTELVDFTNNVIYNWASNNVYGGEGGTYNITNNYYKPGPSTNNSVKARVANPYKTSSIPFGKYYVVGNYIDGNAEVSRNNWLGVTMNGGTSTDAEESKVTTPFAVVAVPTQKAVDVYNIVLKSVGASLPKRDTLDERIINNVKNRTGKIIDVQGGYPHGTSYDISKKAWPVLKSSPALKDSDNDGMPDAWERKNRLNPNDAKDSSVYKMSKHYTNIEMYLNSLITAK
jgi:pectate lyase